MIEEYEKRKRQQVALRRSLSDYGMGLIIFLIGVFFFFRNRMDISFNEQFPPNEMDKIFGGICMVYGIWRIYRGYQKKYFK